MIRLHIQTLSPPFWCDKSSEGMSDADLGKPVFWTQKRMYTYQPQIQNFVRSMPPSCPLAPGSFWFGEPPAAAIQQVHTAVRSVQHRHYVQFFSFIELQLNECKHSEVIGFQRSKGAACRGGRNSLYTDATAGDGQGSRGCGNSQFESWRVHCRGTPAATQVQHAVPERPCCKYTYILIYI